MEKPAFGRLKSYGAFINNAIDFDCDQLLDLKSLKKSVVCFYILLRFWVKKVKKESLFFFFKFFLLLQYCV